jgi:hypothetical protein
MSQSAQDRKEKVGRIATYSGAVVGFISFIIFGAVPGLLYGGYMGLIMSGIIQGTTDPTWVTRIITGGGMLLGVVASFSLFMVVGASLGLIIALVGLKIFGGATAGTYAESHPSK